MESQSQTQDAVMETSKWRGDLGVWTGVILIGFILLGNSCVGVPWFQSGNIFFYTLRFFLQPSLLKAHTDTAQRSAHASYMIWQANKCTRWNMGFSVRILKRLPINSEWCASRDLCFLYLFFSFFLLQNRMNDEIKLQFIINLSGKEGNHKAHLFLFLLTLSLKKDV